MPSGLTECQNDDVIATTTSSASPALAVESAAPGSTPTPASPPPSASSVPPPAPSDDGPRLTIATPYVKKLAKQHKVQIDTIIGSGPYGRITAADIEAAAGKIPAPKPQPAATPAPSIAAPVVPAASKPAAQTSSVAAVVPGLVVPFSPLCKHPSCLLGQPDC
ncbi:hypothetical protein L7F22_053542 [Adiantum nelumboides]|nr:hypothetical protein [Adiantum nelumboides]